MSFPDELTAFRAYAKLYPSACILLADTYDTLGSGVPNAIRVFQEMRDAGIPLTSTASASTAATLHIFPRKPARCWMTPDSRMQSSPPPTIWMNT